MTMDTLLEGQRGRHTHSPAAPVGVRGAPVPTPPGAGRPASGGTPTTPATLPAKEIVLASGETSPHEARYPDCDAALRGAEWEILAMLKKFARPRRAAALARLAAGDTHEDAAEACGLAVEEIEFYLNPKIARWMEKPGG